MGIGELMEKNVKHISFHNQSTEPVNCPVIAVRWFSSRGPWEQKLLESRVFELKNPITQVMNGLASKSHSW